jgi:hypothetical protein
MAGQEGWTYDIDHRTSTAPRVMRGFLIDGEHLFLGYTAWDVAI